MPGSEHLRAASLRAIDQLGPDEEATLFTAMQSIRGRDVTVLEMLQAIFEAAGHSAKKAKQHAAAVLEETPLDLRTKMD